MRLRFTILGYEVAAIEFDRADEQEVEDAPCGMEGGSGHNFERDMNPPGPSGEEPWVDRGFGFRR